MTNIDIVESFLRENPNILICDDCLSKVLKINPRQQINIICRDKLSGLLIRKKDICDNCGGNKIINKIK